MTGIIEQAEAMLPAVVADLARAKITRNELRAELHAAESEVDRLKSLHASLTAVVDGTNAPEPSEGLTGWRVGEAAAAVLRDAGTELHYREVWARMRDRGDVIESDDPEAVVLTALTRHPDVERADRGTYRITEDA